MYLEKKKLLLNLVLEVNSKIVEKFYSFNRSLKGSGKK